MQNSILNENKRQLTLPEKQLMQLAAQQVQRDLEIINDVIELVNTTTKSGAFFHRLDLLLEHSRHIVRFEGFVPFKGGSPAAAYHQVLDQTEKAIDLFVDRCISAATEKADSMKTERGKGNQFVKLYEAMAPFRKQLMEDRFARIEHACKAYLPEVKPPLL